MTHRDALAGNRAGLPGADCAGTLTHVDSFDDSATDAGRPEPRLVTVYQCDRCARRVSVARRPGPEPDTYELAMRPLNSYRWSADDLVAELARAFTAPVAKRTLPNPGRE